MSEDNDKDSNSKKGRVVARLFFFLKKAIADSKELTVQQTHNESGIAGS